MFLIKMNHIAMINKRSFQIILIKGCKQDWLESCQYNFIACDYGLTEGCVNAGICRSEGIGGWPVDVQDSLKFLDKACDDKHPVACLKLFKIFVEGRGNVAKDGARAFEYTKRTCDYGDVLGCFNASRMLRIGDGVAKDLKLSEEFRSRAEAMNKEIESHRGSNTPIVMGEQHK
jgi:TPR repeat protein